MDVDREGAMEIVGTPARQEIVFVDPTVRDFQTLIDGIDNPNARVVLLDPNRDGVQQVAEVLKQYKSVDAVHIISHGSEGQLDLGSSVLNSVTMSATYADELAAIGEHLSKDADFLVYGCDFGRGAGRRGRGAGAGAAHRRRRRREHRCDGSRFAGRELGSRAPDGGGGQRGRGRPPHAGSLARRAGAAYARFRHRRRLGRQHQQGLHGRRLSGHHQLPRTLNGDPTLNNNFTGGVAPAQNALQFTLGPRPAPTP